MNKHILAVILGVAGWLIGYAAGIPLLVVPEYMHTSEAVLAALFGMLFAAWYFFRVGGNYTKEGLQLGMIWLVIMVVLDWLFLVPFVGGEGAWFASIGLGYLGIPVKTTIFGWALERIVKK